MLARPKGQMQHADSGRRGDLDGLRMSSDIQARMRHLLIQRLEGWSPHWDTRGILDTLDALRQCMVEFEDAHGTLDQACKAQQWLDIQRMVARFTQDKEHHKRHKRKAVECEQRIGPDTVSCENLRCKTSCDSALGDQNRQKAH